MKFVATNFKTILIVALVILAIFLFQRGCGGSQDEKIKALKAENAALQKKHKQDSISFAAQYSRWQDSIRTADINSDLQVKVIKETEKKLQASQSTINRLTSIIRNDHLRDTTNMILVSSDYKTACDSLPAEIDKQNEVIGQLHKDNESLVDLMNYEVVYRDSLIEVGNNYINTLRGSYNAQSQLLKAALDAGRPRGKVLGGICVMGNQQQLAGANVKLGYQDKRGKVYLVSGHVVKFPPMVNLIVMYEAGVMFKLF